MQMRIPPVETVTGRSIVAVDILVVGFGPVGAAIAALLGRYGVRAYVVDKATEIMTQPRAIALDNEALRILQMVGLDDDAFEKIAIPEVRMHSPYVGQFGRIRTAGSIDGHAKLVTFFQPDLERALRTEVGRYECVSVATGMELVDFKEVLGGVLAQVRDAAGALHEIRARFVVGADGAASLVRKKIGQDFSGETYPEDWLIVDAKDVPATIDHIEFICDPKRPTPHMPAPGRRERWEFMLRAGEKREDMDSDQRIAELLAPWAKAGHLRIERRAVYRFHARCCTNFRKGRVFLAGDAAHITPPFVGQGLVAGLRDAANLSWKLAAVVQDRADPSILDSYDEERRPHASAMIGLAKLMGRMVMPSNALIAVLTHGAVRLLRLLPSLRRFIDELGIKPRNRFSKGLFVRGCGQLVRGQPIPQGWMRDTTGRIVLSDRLLDGGLTLLGFGVHPETVVGPQALQDWRSAGGQLAQICHRSQQLGRHVAAGEDLEGCLVPRAAPFGWLAVVRPDRVLMHDGPAEAGDRLIREALELLGKTFDSISSLEQSRGGSHA